MTALASAKLLRLEEIKGTAGKAATLVAAKGAKPFEVQFNPTSLKISRQNNVDKGGATTHTQRRQSPSSQPATLTFDLEFDTAELFLNGAPVDVRTRTAMIRQFVEPTKAKPPKPPPPVKFVWGTFSFKGIVSQLNEDLDYFSPNGTPLRAKCSVTITEQDADWELNLVGFSARDANGATPPGGAGGNTGPGAKPATNPTTAVRAQAGESVQQLLSRVNADPATWRAAMAGLASPLTLAAGAQVQLGARVSAGAGIGVSAGFSAGVGVSATAGLGAALGISGGAGLSAGAGFSAGLGLSGGAGLSAGAGFSAGLGLSGGAVFSAGAGFAAGVGVAAGPGEVEAGFALSAAGGVAASLNIVAAAHATASVAKAKAAFGFPAIPGGLSVGAAAPVVDLRAQTFGIGIPLRARTDALTVADTAVGGGLSLSARATAAEITMTTNASVPPWRQLPSSAGERATADARQRSRDARVTTMRWK